MKKWKKGDRVKLTTIGLSPFSEQSNYGPGVVIGVAKGDVMPVNVTWDLTQHNNWYPEKYLEEEMSPMQRAIGKFVEYIAANL